MRGAGLRNGFKQEVGFTVDYAEHCTTGHRGGTSVVAARAGVVPNLIGTGQIAHIDILEALGVNDCRLEVARLVVWSAALHVVSMRSDSGSVRPAMDERDDFFYRA